MSSLALFDRIWEFSNSGASVLHGHISSFQNQLYHRIISGIPSVSKFLDRYQDQQSASLDLGQKCLQILSVDV